MEVKSLVCTVLVSVCATSPSIAQAEITQAEVIEEQLAKSQYQLDQNESRLNRLQELRLRLAFGLPVAARRHFALDANQRELVGPGGAGRLAVGQAELQRLSRVASDLQAQCDLARRGMRSRNAEMTARAGASSPVGKPASPHAASVADPSGERSLANWVWDDAPTSRSSESAEGAGATSRPSGDTSVAGTTLAPASRPHALTPLATPVHAPAQERDHSRVITGSSNGSAVARMLLRSGESIMRRAARFDDGEGEQAQALRSRGREVLESAKREFESILDVAGDESPELIDLYHLARCEEQLGNIPVADSHYAEIISRDRSISPEGVESYGRWGRAAQSAKSVLRWVSDTGGWKPDIDSIQWNQH